MKHRLYLPLLPLFIFFSLSQSLFYLTPLLGLPPSLSKEKRQALNQLHILQSAFETGYAPSSWKKHHLGWDLYEEIKKARKLIESSDEETCVNDYQRYLRHLFNSSGDYHVAIFFYSTEAATLPFHVKSFDGRYYISYIDRDKLPVGSYRFDVGDELILFNGRPVAETIEELKKQLPSSNPATDDCLACDMLTERSGMLAHKVPQGPISICLRRISDKKEVSYQLIWDYTPEQLNRRQINKLTHEPPPFSHKGLNLLHEELTSVSMLYPPYKATAELQENKVVKKKNDPYQLGGRYSYVPQLGRLLWTTDEEAFFHASLFEIEGGKRVGYLRIADYQGDTDKVKQFLALIELFETQSEALVVDQINNPGGSPFYLYALASALTDYPLRTPRHRVILTHREAMMAASTIPLLEVIQNDEQAKLILGDNLQGNPVTYQVAQFFLHYLRFALNEWHQGKSLTSPYYLFGFDEINPHPEVQYTKPILILTNCMDFSGGDFFPVIFKDNKRATILGERTAGAGGIFSSYSHLNTLGIRSYHLTTSIAERLDGTPIESLGVEPDIAYKVTLEDFLNGYSGYKEAIVEALKNLMK